MLLLLLLPQGRPGTQDPEPPPFGQRQPLAPGGTPAGVGAGPAQVLTAGLLSLLIAWTLLGNLLVCAAVVRSRHLRARVTHVFVVSLAVSDLCVALLVMPWKAAAEVAGHWPFGAFCDVWVAFDIMCSTASILNLCVISVDRYWAISRPFRYQRGMTRRVALAMVGLAWALSVLISFIPVQLHWHRGEAGASPGALDPPGDLANGTTSSWEEDNCDSSLNRTYAIASSLVSFYIPVAIMVVTYARIYRIARAQVHRIACLERAGQRAQRVGRGPGPPPAVPAPMALVPGLRASLQKETKVLKTLSVIMGVFVCCWLPFFLLNCLAPFCGHHPGFPCVSATTFDVFVWCGWANSALNPVIYACNADFRRVFARLLGCGRRCAPRPRLPTVTGSRELVSYDPDTTVFSGDTAAVADSNGVPIEAAPRHREGDKEEEQEEEDPLNHRRRVSQAPPEGDPAAQSVWELDWERETPSGKTTPFTSSGFH